jgi:hypothetical protein
MNSLGVSLPLELVRSFSTTSRPALRAAACGGRPRPATTAGRPTHHRGTSASATADAERRPDKHHRRHSKHKLLNRPGALAGQQHEVDQHEKRDDYQEDGTYQRVHGGDANRPIRRRKRQSCSLGLMILVTAARPWRLPTRLVVTEDGPHPSPELVTVAAPPEPGSFSPAVPSACPIMGRAGAASDR